MKTYSRHLIKEPSLQVYPTLARAIGLNEAIFLQQIHFWISKERNLRDGRYWVYNSKNAWKKQFPFWSIPTIKRIISNLRRQGLLITTDKYNKMSVDKTLWYTIDYEAVDRLPIPKDQNDPMDGSDEDDAKDQPDPTNNQRLSKEELEYQELWEAVLGQVSTKSNDILLEHTKLKSIENGVAIIEANRASDWLSDRMANSFRKTLNLELRLRGDARKVEQVKIETVSFEGAGKCFLSR